VQQKLNKTKSGEAMKVNYYFTRVFESFRVAGADGLAINFLVDRLVNLLAFRVVDDGHADVLQPR
jgi:hypothetical protein